MKKHNENKKPPIDQQDQGPEEPQDLSYNEQEDSYEMDVNDADPDWEHPMDYDTISEGAQDDDSTYDEANPFVGEEYATRDELQEDALQDDQMHIDRGPIVHLSTEDEKLAENQEDQREDLDEKKVTKKNDE